MAEGTIHSFAEKLGVVIMEEYKFLAGVEEQVVSLRDELEWISSFLQDAATHRNKYERVNIWVSQIRDLSYDAEDVLDIFIHKVKQHPKRSIRGLIHYPGLLITLHKLGNQIDSFNKRIEKISTYKSRYAIDKLEDNWLGNDVASLNKSRAPNIEEDDVVGFESQSETVAKMLLKPEEDSSQLHVVSIVGMPGAGKSTLARVVYDNVKYKFDSFAWIDVSQQFKSESLVQKMTEQTNGTGKLLVVFDDVWRKEDWDELQSNVLGKFSRPEITVLLTSRSREVAEHANLHEIRLLNPAESLELLKKKASPTEKFPQALEEKAELIANKCHGLPLAIVVLGGLLSTKQKTTDVWDKVLKSESWQLLQGSTDCSEVVALSYDNLPNFLKPCFLYFGLFPEDWKFEFEELIQLWIAEGFIQERGEEAMEDVAEDYLEELIQRNMIQMEERRFCTGPKQCRIHDLLREFVISKGRQDKFLDILGNKGKLTRTMSRRLTVHPTKESSKEVQIPHRSSSKNLRSNNPRSILCFNELSGVRLLEGKSFYKSFGLLRVLDLRNGSAMWDLKRLPDEIGKLILLKYLNLSGARGIKTLPSSIRNLRYLQTLNVSTTGINGIPWSVCELEELRHFYANIIPFEDPNAPQDDAGTNSSHEDDGNGPNGVSFNLLGRKILGGRDHGAPRLPQIGRLKNIRTLSTVVDNRIGDDDLSQLTNLRKLELHGEDIDLYGTALSNAISTRKFIYLRELRIDWERGKLQFPDSLKDCGHLYKLMLSGVIEKFPTDPDAFPPNLTQLDLHRTAEGQEDCDPVKTLADLKNLKFLTLGDGTFLGKQVVFSAGKFGQLIGLDMACISQLEEWKVEEGSLPKLKSLNLTWLQNLRELPDGLRLLTTLEKLYLWLMPQKIKDSIERQVGADWDKVKHIKFIKNE